MALVEIVLIWRGDCIVLFWYTWLGIFCECQYSMCRSSERG